MSHHKKHKHGHRKGYFAPQLVVTAPENFALRVLGEAEKAGARIGKDVAKTELKRAFLENIDFCEEEREELYQAAERAAAAAARASARRLLERNLDTLAPAPAGVPAGTVATAAVSTPQSRVRIEHATHVQEQLQRPSFQHALQHGKGNAHDQHILVIKRTEKLSSEMVRIVAGAPGLDGFRPNGHADQYVKVYIADRSLGLLPPYDLKALRHELPKHLLPRTRSYTIRWVDAAMEELAIDFALHDDPGSAGDWAAKAVPGDFLVISHAKGKFTPPPFSDSFVFAADEAGLPAISSALAHLPKDAQGTAFLEVAGPDSEFEIKHPAGVQLVWLHRNGASAGTTSLLPDALNSLPSPSRKSSVMAHCERSAAKSVSRIVEGWGLEKQRVHVSSYWTLRKGGKRS